MEKRMIAQVSADTLKLEALVTELSHGDKVSYADIAEQTGVEMDSSGKQKLRVAARRAHRVYDCVVGWGIVMASPGSALPILGRRVRSIDRAVVRADKCHSTLQEQFFHSLSPAEQKNILFCGAVFGAIKIAAANGRRLYGKRRGTDNGDGQAVIRIPLPQPR